ncbi:GtrA family protein [Streptococcus pseudoporcinus]|uniref:GtrA-like protein n=1 Tax=Streptococcus pseudoporcinus TaxID=361101 RepID=A0A4U9XK72_9STRE|nr:GtrA family protein [Streptococcus pseudoporcinus]VTS13684.1 GtrA-like protein [Streptococcus pseudoporcinus]VUC66736.1 GtrA-like protein [Streptococcus pseudoporcinus]VUC97665.1 GtrA-like protein [Streptococcus pseudoporcinus]VUC98056.1 GtrA-like protein [Streptococcus pseudoporcinus]
MKKEYLKKIIYSEAFKYLFFGVLATVVYMFSRFLVFSIIKEATISAFIANAVAILFAFMTNDILVFNQVAKGRTNRFFKFVVARLFTLLLDVLLAYLLVEKFPFIVGQFVNHDISLINIIETIIGQVIVIASNYVISKLFIFKDGK